MTSMSQFARPGSAPLHLVDGQQAVIEQAKGALMLRYSIGSYPAFALLIRWSRDAGTSPEVIAQALVRGICQGDQTTENRDPALVRWLEQQMREELFEPRASKQDP
jgi:ANTAR domain